MKHPSPNQPWNLCVWIAAVPHCLPSQTTEGLCPTSLKNALYLSVLWGCLSSYWKAPSLLLPFQGFSPWVYSSCLLHYLSPSVCLLSSSHLQADKLPHFQSRPLHLSAHHCLTVSAARTRQVPPVLTHACCVVSSSSFSTPFHPLPPNCSFYHSTYICPSLRPSFCQVMYSSFNKTINWLSLIVEKIKTDTMPIWLLPKALNS